MPTNKLSSDDLAELVEYFELLIEIENSIKVSELSQ